MPKVHPRTLIRHAIVRVLQEAEDRALENRVFPNRMEHWFAEELPAVGVYALSETYLQADVSPYKDERALDIVMEILSSVCEDVDDMQDALSMLVENSLNLSAIGAAMTALVNERLAYEGKEPLLPVYVDGQYRISIVDTLLKLVFNSTEMATVVDGDREIGVCAITCSIEYAFLEEMPDLAYFLLAHTDWDVEPADGHIDMQSRVEFPAPNKE